MGNFVEKGAHCKVQGLSVVSCAKAAEAIDDLPLRLWSRVGEGTTSSEVFAR